MVKRRADTTGTRAGLWPNLGFGAGLRAEHYDDVLEDPGSIEWFEAISENYFETAGRPVSILERVRRDREIALHGVSLSIGSTDPLDLDYLDLLAGLIERIEPAIVSDHLCFSSFGGRQLYDLLPLPLTEESLDHVTERVLRVQERLGRRILLENPSTYLGWKASQVPEQEFLASLAQNADCGLLLDVNNVFVSCTNMGLDPFEYIDGIPPDRVGQVHLAGFESRGDFLFDTHGRPVSAAVWRLYAHACEHVGQRATMVEWDADIPSYQRLSDEVARARQIAAGLASPPAGASREGLPEAITWPIISEDRDVPVAG